MSAKILSHLNFDVPIVDQHLLSNTADFKDQLATFKLILVLLVVAATPQTYVQYADFYHT